MKQQNRLGWSISLCCCSFAEDQSHQVLALVEGLGSDQAPMEENRLTRRQLKCGAYYCGGEEHHELSAPENWDCWFFSDAVYKSKQSARVRKCFFSVTIFSDFLHFFCASKKWLLLEQVSLVSARSAARTTKLPKPCRANVIFLEQLSFSAAFPLGRHCFSPHKMAAKNHRLSWHCRFKVLHMAVLKHKTFSFFHACL